MANANNSPFNNDDGFDSSFQLETNYEFNKIIESVDEREKNILLAKNKAINLSELLKKQSADSVFDDDFSKKPRSLSPRQVAGIRKHDRFSKISVVSDLSYNFSDSILEGRSITEGKSINEGKSVNESRPISRRMSTVSNTSSKIVMSKRSNGSLRYKDRLSRKPSNSRMPITPRMKLERSNSAESSVIGYRNSIRSFSTTLDGSFQYFDGVSIHDEDAIDENDLIVANRISRINASSPGIVGMGKTSDILDEIFAPSELTGFLEEEDTRTVLDLDDNRQSSKSTGSDMFRDRGLTSESVTSSLPSPSPELMKLSLDSFDSPTGKSRDHKEQLLENKENVFDKSSGKSNNILLSSNSESFSRRSSKHSTRKVSPLTPDNSSKHSRSFSLFKRDTSSGNLVDLTLKSMASGNSKKLESYKSNDKSIKSYISGDSERKTKSRFVKKLKKAQLFKKHSRVPSTSSRKSSETLKFEPSEVAETKSSSSFRFKFHKRSFSQASTNLKDKMLMRNGSNASLMSSSHTNTQSSLENSSGFSHEYGSGSGSSASGSVQSNSVFAELGNPEMFVKHSKILLNATPARKIASENGILYLDLHNLMNLCQSNNNLILDFEDFIQLRMKEIKNKYTIKKYCDSEYSEVFVERSLKSRKIANVLKIIPLSSGKDKDTYSIKTAIQEMNVFNKLQNCQGFINMKYALVVKGEYSKSLLKEWDFNNIMESGVTSKKRPDFYSDHQLYLVLVLNYGGLTLKDYKFQSWHQMNRVFWNLTRVLKTAEFLYKFEHRDLNWENILISDVDEKDDTEDNDEPFEIYGSHSNTLSQTSIDDMASYSDQVSISTSSTKYNLDLKLSIIDFAFSRIVANKKLHSMYLSDLISTSAMAVKSLKDDYRFDIYQLMKQQIGAEAKTNDVKPDDAIDWSVSCPKTNIIWLHYIVDKLLNNKGLKPAAKPTEIRKKAVKSKSVLTTQKNQPGQKSILRNKSKPHVSKNNGLEQDELFEINEYKSYEALKYIHKSLDPRTNITNWDTDKKTQPFFKSAMDDAGDVFKLYKMNHFREGVTFEDFDSLEQVLKWGELNELIL